MGHSAFDADDRGSAWNVGRKLGAKRPLKPKEIWAVRSCSIKIARFATEPCSISRSTVSFAAAISSK